LKSNPNIGHATKAETIQDMLNSKKVQSMDKEGKVNKTPTQNGRHAAQGKTLPQTQGAFSIGRFLRNYDCWNEL